MACVATSISGGFSDPYATGSELPGTLLYASNEHVPFVDQIVINLNKPGGIPYTSILNISVSYDIAGTVVSLGEIKGGSSVGLNAEYVAPAANPLTGLTVTSSNAGSSAVVNVSGNISGAFTDSYWQYKDFRDNSLHTVVSSTNIPDDDIGLFSLKPSFMKYIEITFTVNVTYDTDSAVYIVHKKIINDWDTNRLAVLSQVKREENYRSSNYPKIK